MKICTRCAANVWKVSFRLRTENLAIDSIALLLAISDLITPLQFAAGEALIYIFIERSGVHVRSVALSEYDVTADRGPFTFHASDDIMVRFY
jgi:hypothetical protein